MKRANPSNINTKVLWNNNYKDPEKREEYLHDHTGPTQRFNSALKFVSDGDKVLDIGCGIGIFTKLVKDTYPSCDVTGVDISDTVIEANKNDRQDIKYFEERVGGTNLPADSFDTIFSGETLEHLDYPQTLFQEANHLLKHSGKFIVTTPREDAIRSPEHTWYFTQQDIEDLFLNNGFNDVQFVYLPDMEHLAVIFAIGVKV